jgi:hypothetical protein
MGMAGLTDTEIKRAKATERAYSIGDGGGLYLWVKPTGGKLRRWSYRFESDEKNAWRIPSNDGRKEAAGSSILKKSRVSTHEDPKQWVIARRYLTFRDHRAYAVAVSRIF